MQMMKAPSAKQAGKVLFKAYIVWSVCADIALIGGVFFLLWGTVL